MSVVGPGGAVEEKGQTAMVTDMPVEIQEVALEVVTKSLNEGKSETESVAIVKEEFDRRYGPTWHCILGKNFGSKVTHESKTFLYITINKQLKMLLFKS